MSEFDPVAWIEHHKGGDNLVWEQSLIACSPLYSKSQMDALAAEVERRTLEAVVQICVDESRDGWLSTSSAAHIEQLTDRIRALKEPRHER